MITYLVDIASLLGRWLHLITGIAWIGASFYFVWLDDSLLPPKRKELVDVGVGGEVWAVHGGGFYNAKKYKLAPAELPEPLHWFYWEAYWTWLSGFFLLCLLYFGQAEVYLIDPAVMILSKSAAIAIALAFLAGGWLIYDLLCRSPLGRDERVLAGIIALLAAAAAWCLCALFSGRGAYILFGAMLGTIMVANVFFVIIPGQREMVKAKADGRLPDPVYGLRGKQRSVHNTYFTLPVLFAMISNHYALTFGATHNAFVLIALSLAGACIRAWFVARHKAHERGGRTSTLTLAVGLILIASVAVALAPARQASSSAAPSDRAAVQARFANIQSIAQQRCVPCHSASPTLAGFNTAPNGVLLDTPERLLAHTVQMQTQLSTGVMPIGNLTHMTDEERREMIGWLIDGAPH
jgi:uncharacterized membrane protein